MSSIAPRRMMVYAVAGTGALLLAVFGQPADDTSAAAPVARDTRPETSRGGNARSTLSPNAAAFLTRLAHRTAPDGAAPDLFARHSWYVAPPPPPPAKPAPPAPPMAPPLPFTFLGSYAAQGELATYFLSQGDRIYDAKVGSTIDNDYTLDAADGNTLIFIYKPLGQRQFLPIGTP